MRDKEENLQHTLEAWRRFVDTLDPQVPVRSVILESWHRSHREGIEPDPPSLSLHEVSDDELKRRLKANQLLLAVAVPHLRWLSSALRDIPHVIYLVDKDGIVLSSCGTDQEQMKLLGLLPGYDWSEAAMGTNGAGTAVAANQPVAVIGPEHFSSAFHDCTCTGCPLHTADGTVIGAIDISTSVSDGKPERLILASYLAFNIERELTADTLRKSLTFERMLFEKMTEGIWLEQRQLGREMHDSVCQEITGIRMTVKMLSQCLQEQGSQLASKAAQIARDLKTLEGNFNDIAKGLFPVEGDPKALNSALEQLAAKTSDRFGVSCTTKISRTLHVEDHNTAVHLFRIIQEAVFNAVKHASARSILIIARSSRSGITVEIHDDGVGLKRPLKKQGLGISIMTHRAQLINGKLKMRSPRIGGTVVTCRVKHGKALA